MDRITHPIHRLPVEILRKIFETVISNPRVPKRKYHSDTQALRLRAAIDISHVCGFWRAIAIQTPYLWIHIRIRLDKPQIFIEGYWAIIMERVKDVPIRARVYLPDESSYKKLPLKFSELNRIDSLVFVLGSYDYIDILFRDDFPTPQCPIRKMAIETDGRRVGPFLPVVLLDQGLSTWPAVRRLKLRNARYGLVFTDHFTLPETHDLYFHDQSVISPTFLNKTFPNLRTLSLGGIQVAEPALPATFELVTTLALHGIPERCLSLIQCPALTTLLLAALQPGLITFLYTHPTIQRLESLNDAISIRNVSAALPQLRSISVYHPNSPLLKDLTEQSSLALQFPYLTSLTINDDCNWIQCADFDQFVQRRCLPLSHPGCLGARMSAKIQKFTIIHGKREDSSMIPQWLASKYIGCAKETTTFHYPIAREIWSTTTLEWLDVTSMTN